MSRVENTVPRAAIKQMVSDLTEGPATYAGEAQPFHGLQNAKPGTWVEIDILVSATKGVDDQRLEYLPGTQRNQRTQVGYRILTVQCVCYSYSFDLAAFDVLELLRRRMRSVRAAAAMQEMGVSLVDFKDIRDLDETADTRVVYKATMDMRLAWAPSEVAVDDDGGWIEDVGVIADKLSS